MSPDRPDAPNRDMSITVGWNAALKAGVSREDMDAWAGQRRTVPSALPPPCLWFRGDHQAGRVTQTPATTDHGQPAS
jgi:hypothetical protein